jgi:hypothetical protein
VPGYSLLLTYDHNNHMAPPSTDFVLPVATEKEGNVQAVVGNQLVQELLPCSQNLHFVNPPMFTFCSDSPSVMIKL